MALRPTRGRRCAPESRTSGVDSMKAKRAVRFVPLAVCALLAAGFANGARAQAGPGPDAARRQGGRQPRRLHRRHRLQGEPQRRVDEQSGGRLRQDLRRRQRPDPGPRRPAVADHAASSPALPLLRRLHDAQARHRLGPRLGRPRLHRRRRGQLEDQPQDRRARLRVRLHPPADVRAQRQLRRALVGRGDQALGRRHRHRRERQQHDRCRAPPRRATSRRRCR